MATNYVYLAAGLSPPKDTGQSPTAGHNTVYVAAGLSPSRAGDLAGTISVFGTIIGTLGGTPLLTGTLAGAGAIVGALGVYTPVDGTIAALGTLSGALSVYMYPATISAVGAITGSLIRTPAALSGTIPGVGAIACALSVTEPTDGYRVYRGFGGSLANLVWAGAEGYVDENTVTVTLTAKGHAASCEYMYVVRPIKGGVETPDYSCRVIVEMDADGEWVGNRLSPIRDLSAEVRAAGVIRLRWRYRTDGTRPTDFGIYYDSAPNVSTAGSPDATKAYISDGAYLHDLSLVDGTTYYLVVTARNAAGLDSKPAEVGPLIADDTAPDTPAPLVEATFV